MADDGCATPEAPRAAVKDDEKNEAHAAIAALRRFLSERTAFADLAPILIDKKFDVKDVEAKLKQARTLFRVDPWDPSGRPGKAVETILAYVNAQRRASSKNRDKPFRLAEGVVDELLALVRPLPFGIGGIEGAKEKARDVFDRLKLRTDEWQKLFSLMADVYIAVIYTSN